MLRRTVQDAYTDAYYALKNAQDTMPSTPENIVDLLYDIRECRKQLSDLAKEYGKFENTLVKLICLVWAKMGSSDPIRTSKCTATPRIKVCAPIPKKRTEPDLYFALCDHFKIPRKAAENELFRPHWPSIVEHLTSQAAAGLPLPPGVDPSKMYEVYEVLLKGHKNG